MNLVFLFIFLFYAEFYFLSQGITRAIILANLKRLKSAKKLDKNVVTKGRLIIECVLNLVILAVFVALILLTDPSNGFINLGVMLILGLIIYFIPLSTIKKVGTLRGALPHGGSSINV